MSFPSATFENTEGVESGVGGGGQWLGMIRAGLVFNPNAVNVIVFLQHLFQNQLGTVGFFQHGSYAYFSTDCLSLIGFNSDNKVMCSVACITLSGKCRSCIVKCQTDMCHKCVLFL